MKWHDGQLFTADDVKFTFENMMQYDIFGALYFKDTIVEILDKSTVKITPGMFMPGLQMTLFGSLDTAITPKHVLEGVEDYPTDPFRTESPVGTGPFKFKEWVAGSYLVLERFDDYWAAPAPYLDEIVLRIIPEPATMTAAFVTGEADYQFRGLPYEVYDTLKANPDLNVIKATRPPYKAFLTFNHKAEYISDMNVRQAIAYAIDRATLANLATNGICQMTNSWWTPDITPPSPARTIYAYDPDKAGSLLDKDYPADAAGDRGITIELLTRRGEAEEALAAEMIRDDLSAVGITLELKTVDFATMRDLYNNFDYDIYLAKRWVMSFWTYQLWHSDWIIKGRSFSNSAQYNNSQVDTLFDSWLVEVDPAKQKDFLQQVETIVSDELPSLPLWDLVWLNVIRKTFQPVPGAEIGILPDCRYVFWDSLENMFWTEGTIPATTVTVATTIMVPFGPTKWLWVGAFLTLTGALVTNRRRRKVN